MNSIWAALLISFVCCVSAGILLPGRITSTYPNFNVREVWRAKIPEVETNVNVVPKASNGRDQIAFTTNGAVSLFDSNYPWVARREGQVGSCAGARIYNNREILGNRFYRIHDATLNCNCNFNDSACPLLAQVEINGQVNKYVFADNDEYRAITWPTDIVAPAEVAQSYLVPGVLDNLACYASDADAANLTSSITNDMTGKVCVVRRGNCGFREKYENCVLKGAVAVVVVNSFTSVLGTRLQMSVIDFTPGRPAVDRPFIFLAYEDGANLFSAAAGSATVSLGPSFASDVQLPGYSASEGLIVSDFTTFESSSNSNVFNFATALFGLDYNDAFNKYIWAQNADGNLGTIQALDISDPSQPKLFGAPQDLSFFSAYIFERDGTYYAFTSDYQTNNWTLYDVSKPDNWTQIGNTQKLVYDGIEVSSPGLYFAKPHPQANVVYLAVASSALNDAQPDILTVMDFEPLFNGEDAVHVQDLRLPILSGSNIQDSGIPINSDMIGCVALASEGVVFVDFSDPKHLSLVGYYDTAPLPTDAGDYTIGAFTCTWGTNGMAYVSNDDLFVALKLGSDSATSTTSVQFVPSASNNIVVNVPQVPIDLTVVVNNNGSNSGSSSSCPSCKRSRNRFNN